MEHQVDAVLTLLVPSFLAIQALVVGRIFYLLSISKLGAIIIDTIRIVKPNIRDAYGVIIGIVTTIVLQITFSQWSVMNNLFSTAPLNLSQWLICIVAGLPMILVAASANGFDPLD